MTTEPSCVIHVLSVRNDGGVCRARATVRSGKADVGQVFWFTDEQGERLEVNVADIADSGRHKEIALEGAAAVRIRGGSYLYSVE